MTAQCDGTVIFNPKGDFRPCNASPSPPHCSRPASPPQQLANGNYPLADAAMAATLGRLGCNATVHGMRSAFSTWAHERTGHSNHVIEMCLAHTVGIDIEKAYRRTDQTPRRLSPGEMARLLVPSASVPKRFGPRAGAHAIGR